ncbi:zinc ribbon domain-containing protein [Sinimarinibacterium sp. CAU 1509]|uniref:zinc ribbon domain-containing protein n=1 Tax=Sinimarinibacterium sp. CAU 1509 TaxID=2562283 RepID=UPI0010AC4220|nr:zinc ribbon domain-containing protein [Sinimarinibacterium sp. CAU 1509]TJY58887.1 zinc ribbon domain-containing protein [Sinimarinibacterium sp. CAU 1509]
MDVISIVSLVLLFASWVFVMMGCASAAWGKGFNQAQWLAAGFLLGPIALLVLIAMPPNAEVQRERKLAAGVAKECPTCLELVRPAARQCPHCGSDLPQAH